MAQLLVFLRDNEAERGCSADGAYKPGDVVGVFPDDHVFGSAETVYPFQVVTVPDSELNISVATVLDETINAPKAAMKLPSMRKKILSDRQFLIPKRRRRYTWDGAKIARK